MRYAVKYHDVTGEWLVFDMGEGFELVGMHADEQDAIDHAMKLEERYRPFPPVVQRLDSAKSGAASPL